MLTGWSCLYHHCYSRCLAHAILVSVHILFFTVQKMYYEQMAASHEDALVKLGYDMSDSSAVGEKLDGELDELFSDLGTLSVTNSAAAKSSK